MMGGDGNSLSGSKLMLVLLFLVSLVSVVAIIVAAVSLTNSDSDTPSINVNSLPGVGSSSGGSSSPIIINTGGSGGSGFNSGSAKSGNRIFKIALGHDFGAHEYLDAQGYIQGFMKDLAQGVCEAGGMDCRLIWDEYTNCWDSEAGQHSVGGKGLFNGWYDACSEWLPTVGRVQVFDFSLPMMKMPTYHIYILKSNNNFDTTDVTGLKAFGFIDGYAGDEKCLARQTSIKGSTLPVDKIKHYALRQQCVDALKKGEVQALFGNTGDFGDFEDLKPASEAELSCAIQGFAMMTTKDNDFNSFWNAGFQKFRGSGKFRKLCEQAKADHGHQGTLNTCVDAP